MNDQPAKDKLRVRRLASVLFILIVAAGLVLYFSRGRSEYSQGMAAYEAFDYLSAESHFQDVAGFYRFASSSNASQAQQLLETEILPMLDAAEKRSRGDYAAAIEVYKTFTSLYPDSVHHDPVRAHIPATYLQWADALMQAEEYGPAVEKYLVISSEYEEQPEAQTAGTEVAAAYLKWGDALVESGEFEEAIEKYHILLTEYQDRPEAGSATALSAAAYLKWGDALVESGEFEAAIEKYQILLVEYNDQPEAKSATTQLAAAYLKWGDALAQSGDYERSIKTYRMVLKQYGNEPAAQAALTNMFVAYDSLGQHLMDEKSFIAAMDTYILANALNDDDTMHAKFELGYQTAFSSLIDDTGNDGKRVLSAALKLACEGKPAISPVVGVFGKPVIGLSNNQMASVGLCEGADDISLPEDWIARTPGNLRFAVGIHVGTKFLGACDFTGGHTVRRLQEVREIRVFDVQTGELLKQKEYAGQAPEPCPKRYVFDTSDPLQDAELMGGAVSNNVVQDAVIRMVSPLMPTPDESPVMDTLPAIPILEYGFLPPSSSTQLEMQDPVNSVLFSPDGKWLASSTRNGTLLWDVESGTQIAALRSASAIAFSPDGKWLATDNDHEGTVSVWDVISGDNVLTVQGYGGAVAISPDGKLLATAWSDGVALWEIPSGKQVTTLEETFPTILSIAFSPDGKSLATSSGNAVNLWDVTSGEQVHMLNGHTGWVRSIAFSPDGNWLVSGSEDSTIKLWDVANGNEIRSFTGHTDRVLSVAFSPNGLWLASGSVDNTTKFWNAADGAEIYTLDFHETRDDTGVGTSTPGTNAVTSVAFSPDGKWFATGRSSIWLDPMLNILNLWEFENAISP